MREFFTPIRHLCSPLLADISRLFWLSLTHFLAPDLCSPCGLMYKRNWFCAACSTVYCGTRAGQEMVSPSPNAKNWVLCSFCDAFEHAEGTAAAAVAAAAPGAAPAPVAHACARCRATSLPLVTAAGAQRCPTAGVVASTKAVTGRIVFSRPWLIRKDEGTAPAALDQTGNGAGATCRMVRRQLPEARK